nr:MAG TPA: hypothetical protein [Caudoviricetes sp.]
MSQTYKVCNDISTVLVCHKLRSLSQTCDKPRLNFATFDIQIVTALSQTFTLSQTFRTKT